MSNVELIKQTLNPVFRNHSVKKAVLFGSYAKGTETSSSDIDIYVDSGLKGLKFFGLLEDVASTLDRPVDLIDASQVDENSKVMKEINSTGITIYG